MSEKSHVSMERQVCLVCTTQYDTGAILLDRKLRPCLDRYTLTGWGLCSEHQRLFDEGYVALVECNLSAGPEGGADCAVVDAEHVHRTGRIAHLTREVFARVFNAEIAPSFPCVFVEPDVMARLEELHRRSAAGSGVPGKQTQSGS